MIGIFIIIVAIFMFSKAKDKEKINLNGTEESEEFNSNFKMRGNWGEWSMMDKQQDFGQEQQYYHDEFIRMQQEQFDMIQNELTQTQFHEQMQNDMEESLKTVTPWEHGGYDMTQGNSFNDHSMHGL